MTPKQIVQRWVDTFNKGDVKSLAKMYSEDAVNYQVANEPIHGRAAIKQIFEREFARAEMTSIVENIFEDRDWGILEWKDPKGLRGCGFFQIKNDQIIFQRGYWDKLSFLKQQGLPLD